MQVSTQIKAVTEDGHISWHHKTEEVRGNGEILYSCKDCDFDIDYMDVEDCDFEEEMDDEYCVGVWMQENCDEYIDRPKEEQDEGESHQGPFLKFACPQCGAHEFEVFRDGCSEVTPVEYVSEEGELSFGRMTYVGGQRTFHCLDCDYRFGIDESLGEGKALAKWLIDNCNQG